MADPTQPQQPADDSHVTPSAEPAGRRGGRVEVRDTVADLTARAHELNQEAGTKITSALRDVINAAAGLAGFAVESARDLVHFMVRRGQMTPDEAERLLQEAERGARKAQKEEPATRGASKRGAKKEAKAPAVKGATKTAAKTATKSGATKGAAKSAAKAPAKEPAKGAAKKAAAKRPTKRADARPAAKPAKKAAAKKRK